MRSRRQPAWGFTLIELLVVIAILSLLVAVLLPSLARAKDISLRTICQANYKTMGRLIHTFASTHGGRGPSACMGTDTWGQNRGRSWVGYINVEVLGQRNYWQQSQSGYIQGMGFKASKGSIYCPSEYQWSTVDIYRRAHELNLDVAGGDSVNLLWDAYGINVDPPPSLPLADDFIPSGKWNWYGLGPLMERFPRPGYKFLVTETEAGWEYCHAIWPYNPLLLNDSAYTTPAWTALGGSYAFRHVLPKNKTLFQAQATANFLYIDGHVNIMTANEPINRVDRFSLVTN